MSIRCSNCRHPCGIHTREFRRRSNLSLSLIRSDFVPSPMEQEVINQTIQETHSEIESLDDEILQVEALFSRLTEQKRDLVAFTRGQQSLLSPIRRIPAEILGDIFLYCCPAINIGNWRGNSLVWQLGEVCYYWRTVIMSLHEIWARMDITMQAYMARPQEYPGYMKTIDHLVATCLSRSGDCPLSFALATHGTHPAFSSVFDQLFAYSDRWFEVSLEVDWLTFLPNLTQIKDRIPRLRSLTLKARIGTGHYIHPIDAFEVAPQLSRLEIENFPYPVFRLKIPWFQLTHYKSISSSHGPGEFCEILRRMPNLKYFETSLDRGLPGQGTDHQWLLNLRELSVRVPSFYLSNILDPLISPNLNNFRLSGSDSTDNFTPDAILSLFQRSGCMLRSLTLTSTSVNCVYRILEQCPSIELLNVGFLDYAQDLLHELVWRGIGAPLLAPNLHTFVLSFCHDGTELVEILVDLLRSRMIARPCDSQCTSQAHCPEARLRFVHANLRCAANRPSYAQIALLEQFRAVSGFNLSIEM